MVIVIFVITFILLVIYQFITTLLFEWISDFDDDLGKIFLMAWVVATVITLIYFVGSVV